MVRPIGTAIFMAVDRRYGRSTKLTTALFLLGTSTVAIAFLPSHAQAGTAAPFFLGLFRIGQGLALGGTWDGLASLLALNVPQKRRGWYAMIPQLGALLGLMVASALFAFFIINLSADDFFGWGWRYPFFVAFAINVVALFARLRLVVTPEYTQSFESRELQPMEITKTVKAEGRNILIGAFAPIASFAMFHMVTVFPLSWVFLFTHQGAGRFLIIETIAAAIGVFAISPRRARLRTTCGTPCAAHRNGQRDRGLQRFCAAIARQRRNRPDHLHGAGLYPARPVLWAELRASPPLSAFRAFTRYTASALTADFAWLLGAGFAPLLCAFAC